MTTRTPTGRAIEVPNLVGVRADRAIQMLRELGLLPVTSTAEVRDVNDAGVVLGLDPPAGTLVRRRGFVMMSIAVHPDFAGHADDSLPEKADKLVEPTLTGPEIRGGSAVSPTEPRDDSAELQQRDFLPMRLW